MKINDLIITSLDSITAYDVTGTDYLYTLEELQDATIAQTEDKNDVTGKNGRKITSLKRNKAVTVSGNNGTLSAGLLASQTGSELEEKNVYVQWTEYVTLAEADKAKTTYKAAGTSGAEIDCVYVRNSDGSLGDKYTQGASAAAKVFTYDPSTKELTFAEGSLAAKSEILVIYHRYVKALTFDNESDKFSGKAQLYIDATAEDKCANIYHVQFYIPKADFNGEFSLEIGGDQSVHNFEAEALAGGCVNGSKFYTFSVFGDNADTDVTGG